MSDILCVTNRKLCHEPFLQRIAKIAAASPAGIILREKDLSESEYRNLAAQVMDICRQYQVHCILHTFPAAAVALNATAIHLPLPLLRNMSQQEKQHFSVIGASCHSVQDALEAEQLGCTYITAGHVFATACKRGVPPRGTDFLKNVCENVRIPVYGIGGIGPENLDDVYHTGAKGGCIMSGLMTCEDVKQYMKALNHEKRKTNEL